jgi:3-deoxy-D-manno-octulosonic-acid transferase
VRTLYNILFLIFFALSSPYYFWRMRRRGGWRAGFGERFAIYDAVLKQALTNRHVIWIHAVSVGEVNLCTQLINALEPRVPNVKFVVSCTTTTGMAELRRRLPTRVSKIYYPVDRANLSAARSPPSIPRPSFSWRRKSGRTFSGARQI